MCKLYSVAVPSDLCLIVYPDCTYMDNYAYRAVYRDSDIILLDDPLSAVNAAVSRYCS